MNVGGIGEKTLMEVVGSMFIQLDRVDPFASKPAPTGDLCAAQTQCGIGLAREGILMDIPYF